MSFQLIRTIKITFLALAIFATKIAYTQDLPDPAKLSTGQGAAGTLDPIWQVSDRIFGHAEAKPNPIGLAYSAAIINITFKV